MVGFFKSRQKAEETAAPAVRGDAIDRERRPVIGVCGSNHGSRSVIAMMTQLRSAGAEPVYIGHHAERIKGGVDKAVSNDLARIDALVVLGNDGDINPAKYGQKAHPQTKIETDTGREQYEEAVIQKAMDQKIPLLAVCGGMQRINVLGGGTLHQHVPDLVGDDHHFQGNKVPPYVPVQFVKIQHDSQLKDIAGSLPGLFTPQHTPLPEGVIMENSFHHQAVKDIRDDFKVNAISDDGIIEGIEPKKDSRYGNQFLLGVQFHPEFGASDLGAKIAMRLSEAARQYAQEQGRGADASPAGVMGELTYEGTRASSILSARHQQMHGQKPGASMVALSG